MSRKNNKAEIEQLVEKNAPGLIRGLPTHFRNQVLNNLPNLVSIETRVHTSYSGMLPQTTDLERYNELIPNGAERIMALAESQSAHRQEIEKARCAAQDNQSGRGQIFAFIVSLLLIGSGFYSVYSGMSWVAATIFGTTTIGLAAVFVVGKKLQIKDLFKKS